MGTWSVVTESAGKLPTLSSPHGTGCCPEAWSGPWHQACGHRVAPRVHSPGTAAASGALPVPVTGPAPRTRRPAEAVTAPEPRVWFGRRVPGGPPAVRAWLCRIREARRQTDPRHASRSPQAQRPRTGAAPGRRVRDPAGSFLSPDVFWLLPGLRAPGCGLGVFSPATNTRQHEAPGSECRPQARLCARLLSYSNSGKRLGSLFLNTFVWIFREGKGKRTINRLPPPHRPLRIEPNPGTCPEQESNQ